MQKSTASKTPKEKPSIEKARDIIRKNPTLIWYSKNYDNFDLPCIVEAVLNYGDWDEFKELVDAIGLEEVAEVFYQHVNRPRCNYKPEIKKFFTEVFARNAPRNSNEQTKTTNTIKMTSKILKGENENY